MFEMDFSSAAAKMRKKWQPFNNEKKNHFLRKYIIVLHNLRLCWPLNRLDHGDYQFRGMVVIRVLILAWTIHGQQCRLCKSPGSNKIKSKILFFLNYPSKLWILGARNFEISHWK
jgi:hypothetical protein